MNPQRFMIVIALLACFIAAALSHALLQQGDVNLSYWAAVWSTAELWFAGWLIWRYPKAEGRTDEVK